MAATKNTPSVAATGPSALLTPEELLQRLRLPVNNIQGRTARLRARGLRPTRVGKTLLYAVADVEAFILARSK